MKILTILQYLESVAPLSLQENYDNSGLIFGDPDWETDRVLLCLDLTEEVMVEAIQKGCRLIISHHPFIFHPIKKFLPELPETNILTKAISSQIAIFAMHTNLDNSLRGLNAFLFNKLGITSFRILKPQTETLFKLVAFCPTDYAERVREAMFKAGAGHIGNYDFCSFNVTGDGSSRAHSEAKPFTGEIDQVHFEKELRIEVILPDYARKSVIAALLANHPYEEVAYDIYPLMNTNPLSGAGLIGDLNEPMNPEKFLQKVKNVIQIPILRHSKLNENPVTKIALCTGSGNFLIPVAQQEKADVFLTGDLKYHDFFSVRKNLILADIGHYESEQWVKEWLYAVLIEKFPTFAFLISEINTNPVYHL
ncbi:MAG: Nif3-like dinuclear metal center hexameric protein [Bacteroidales bacterium]|nr:Nif3-like dinuclear metal center hexameric protein [Bacteroidales bacterium]